MGFISHHKIEWRLVGDRMGVMIVCEFCMENFVSPGGGVRFTEDSQIGFNFLVDSFSFSVRLKVIGSGEGKIIVEEFSKFFGKG